MEDLKKIKKVLDACSVVLCDNLAPSDILRELKAAGALKANQVEEIRNEGNTASQIEKMLDMLRRTSLAKYEKFMNVLKNTRDDLYKQVVEIEEKNGYYRSGESLITHVLTDSPFF